MTCEFQHSGCSRITGETPVISRVAGVSPARAAIVSVADSEKTRGQDGLATRGQDARDTRHGMTLVELMVSVAVLMLLMVAFGMILSTSQKVVTSSNALMQCNSAAAAIAQVIRKDILSLSKEGFLSIWRENQNYPYRDHLVFTTVGLYITRYSTGPAAMLPSITANAARIDYGRTTSSGIDRNIFWRRETLLAYGVNPIYPDDNFENQYLSAYADWPEAVLNTGMVNPPRFFTYKPGSLTGQTAMVAKPAKPSDIEGLRFVLATDCTNLKISWLDNSTATPKWVEANTTPKSCNAASFSSTNPWPVAIKINFTLSTRPELPKYSTERMDMDYEVICPIRQ